MWNPLASLPPSNALAAYSAPQTNPVAAMTPLSAGSAVAGLPGRNPRMHGGPIPGQVPGPVHGPTGPKANGGPMDDPQGFHAALQAWRQSRPDMDFSAFLGLQAPDGMNPNQALRGWQRGAPMPGNFSPGFAAAAQPYFDWGAARPMRSDF